MVTVVVTTVLSVVTTAPAVGNVLVGAELREVVLVAVGFINLVVVPRTVVVVFDVDFDAAVFTVVEVVFVEEGAVEEAVNVEDVIVGGAVVVVGGVGV